MYTIYSFIILLFYLIIVINHITSSIYVYIQYYSIIITSYQSIVYSLYILLLYQISSTIYQSDICIECLIFNEYLIIIIIMNILRLSRQCVQLSLRSPRFMFSRSELLDDVESMVIKKVSEMPTVEANKVNINSHLLNDLQIDSLT